MADLGAGDIVVVDFPGALSVKRRPAIVLSSDAYHATRPDVILGLITSRTTRASGPSDCVLEEWERAGLRVPSAFRCFLVTLPRSASIFCIGRLTDRDWAAVRASVGAALAT